MAPVIRQLESYRDAFEVVLCATAQHRELLTQAQELFGLTPDVDLDLMRPDQSLNRLSGSAFTAIDDLLATIEPDWLLVQGDTTTAAVGAWAGFHRRIKVGHVEAGLRTRNLAEPFPEEANRRLVDHVSVALFAPTSLARRRLIDEGVPPANVHLTGNTIVDSVRLIRPPRADDRRVDEVLVTVHRRESFGVPMRGIFAALIELAKRYPAIDWTFPVHPNPAVHELAHSMLSGLANLHLVQPLDYRDLLDKLATVRLVLTDSGGLQEEAPAFGTPVLVLRRTTERPEGLAAGVARLAGWNRQSIVDEAARLLDDDTAWASMAKATNPYGDGHASERIRAILAGEEYDSLPEPSGVTEAASAADQSPSDIELRDLRVALADVERELASIHESKWWKLASLYWNARRSIIRLLRWFARSARQAMPVAIKRRLRWLQSSGQVLSGSIPNLVRQNSEVPPPGPGYDVLCLPIIDWEFRFQRPQHLMLGLAARGHRVFVVRTLFHGHKGHARVERLGKNVFGLRVAGPPGGNIYTRSMTASEDDAFSTTIDRLRSELNLQEVVLIVQHPYWQPLAERLRTRFGWRIVYDCMDDHEGFAVSNESVREDEQRLAESCDLLVVSSPLLRSRLQQEHKRTPLLLRNAAELERFRPPSRIAGSNGNRRPVIGYYGAIAEWFDAGMVASAAAAHQDWEFVLVGGTVGADLAPLAGLENVRLLGERPYAEIPALLSSFDVATIPFRRIPLTEATDPVKFYEYLAGGKPVVASDLPALRAYDDIYYPVRRPDEFTSAIERALSEDSAALRDARIRWVEDHSWEARAQALDEAISGCFPKTSIIIVSYNNLEYLQQSLESVWNRTLWPNLEVIVVDNHSDTAVRQYLRGAAQHESRLKLILNDENVGFPRANNQGIEAAVNADYLVLLNDDTIVTTGWLGRLLRHLEAPGVELVGPVTNWAGNEAKIEVGYQDITRLDEFADAYVLDHEHETRDIRVLGMYCVAMRRTLIDRIGPLDERFGIGMFEDDDFAERVRRAGGRVVLAEDVFIHHWGRASFGALEPAQYERIFDENRRQYEQKWGKAWVPHKARRQTDSPPNGHTPPTGSH